MLFPYRATVSEVAIEVGRRLQPPWQVLLIVIMSRWAPRDMTFVTVSECSSIRAEKERTRQEDVGSRGIE